MSGFVEAGRLGSIPYDESGAIVVDPPGVGPDEEVGVLAERRCCVEERALQADLAVSWRRFKQEPQVAVTTLHTERKGRAHFREWQWY